MNDSAPFNQITKTGQRQPVGADIINWIVRHPVYAFILLTLVTFVLAAVMWRLLLYWPVSGPNIENKDLWSNASTLVQALLGTALVGSSAFVAIMIATSATRAADAALKETQLSNKLNSPEYRLAFDAYLDYLHLQALRESFNAAKLRVSDGIITIADMRKPFELLQDTLQRPALVVLAARTKAKLKQLNNLDINIEIGRLLALNLSEMHGKADQEMEKCTQSLNHIFIILDETIAHVRSMNSESPDPMLTHLREMLPPMESFTVPPPT